MTTTPKDSPIDIRAELQKLHNTFHGRLATHEEVARRSGWPPHVLDGVQIEDEEMLVEGFTDEQKSWRLAQNQLRAEIRQTLRLGESK